MHMNNKHIANMNHVRELPGTGAIWDMRVERISNNPTKWKPFQVCWPYTGSLSRTYSNTNPTQSFYFYLYSLVLSNILRTLILPSFYLSLYYLIIPPYILNHALLFNHSLSRFCTVLLFLYAYDGSLHSWYSALCKQHCTIVIMLAEGISVNAIFCSFASVYRF